MLHEGLIISVLAASMSFGTIHDDGGSVSHLFWLRNDGANSVRVIQTFPSCGCTSISYNPVDYIQPHDSVGVNVTYNPRHRGGEFYETATVVLASTTDTTSVTLSIEGNVITSEETLLRQFPIRRGNVRLTTDTLNMGEVRREEQKTMYVGVLTDLQKGEKTSVPVTFLADDKVGWGAQYIKRCIPIRNGRTETIVINAVVLPNVSSQSGILPKLSAPRILQNGTHCFTITNTGQSTLTVYRVYIDNGSNLTESEINIPQGRSAQIKVKDKCKRITIISNDPRHPRFVIRITNTNNQY